MDAFELHLKAISMKPDIPQSHVEYVVAVLHFGKRLETLDANDFTWFMCKGRHAISKIRKQYMQMRPEKAVIFKQGDRTPPEYTQMVQLDDWNDGLIVFSVEAVGHVAPNALVTQNVRSPLGQVHNQMGTKLESSDEFKKWSLFPSVSRNSRPSIRSPAASVKNEWHVRWWDSLDPAATGGASSLAFSRAPGTSHVLHQQGLSPPPYHPSPPLGLNRLSGSSHSDQPGFERYAQYQRSFLGRPLPVPDAAIAVASQQQPAHLSPFLPLLHPAQRDLPKVYPTAADNSSTMRDATEPNPKQDLSQANPFRTSPSPDAKDSIDVKAANDAQNNRIREIIAESLPEALEAEVKSSIAFLDQIKAPMVERAVNSEDAQQWLSQIETLQKQSTTEPTIIGVVGNTGAGKSSVINAMLDEERIVPTNCMRACTATISEISWNSDPDPNAKYRANIEFIKSEDWEKELRVLFAELIDASGHVSKECSNEDSEAGIAYAKIKAVYPNKTKDDIAKSDSETLLQDPAVRNILGTTLSIQDSSPDTFYKHLQKYVDSKEKSEKDKKDKDKTKGPKEKKTMEFWPLIKVVKIYTKAAALATGAIVVDLPGVHDSNAARSAIAGNYMKNCTGLWIVAPINRAVDDKAAKSLLGESFKRQLKYDGTYSRVTFICSKTDDISVTEASDSLGLEEVMSPKWDRVDQIESEQKALETQLAEMRETRDICSEVMNDTDDQLEIWDKLKEDVEDGKTTYPPSSGNKKRKRSEKATKSRKQRRTIKDSDDEATSGPSDDDCDDDEDEEESVSSHKEPLSDADIDAKIAELKATKKEARISRRDLDAKIGDLKDNMKAKSAVKKKIEAEMNAICIAGRNTYSKTAIQQDFAAGIKELDQENAAEEDEENFNPEEDIRDYDEVARSLPVFCISSRAYQKLSGRMIRDASVPGFSSADETEVPQLQAHCRKLTEAGRAASCRRFLNNFTQLMNSLAIWASNDGTEISLTDAQMAAEAKFLKSRLEQLEKGLEKAAQDTLKEMKETLAENIYDHFEKVIAAAVEQANDTVAKWSAPVNRENRAAGGFYWSTYKAIVRRDGVYSNAQGAHDFNSQLAEPMMKQLASHWEKAFTRRLPNVLQSFTQSGKALLKNFHDAVETRTRQHGTGIAGLAMLGQQLATYERIFKDLAEQMVALIINLQRDANREFVPAIARKMASAYQWCTDESGPGQYMRMKLHMKDHVDVQRQVMFKQSTDEVKTHLTMMCRQVEEALMNSADEVFVNMRRDYMQVVTGSHMPKGHEMPKWERNMRAGVKKIIDKREEAAIKELEGPSEEETVIEEPKAAPRNGVKIEQSDESNSDNANPNDQVEAELVAAAIKSEEPESTISPESVSAPESLKAEPKDTEMLDTLINRRFVTPQPLAATRLSPAPARASIAATPSGCTLDGVSKTLLQNLEDLHKKRPHEHFRGVMQRKGSSASPNNKVPMIECLDCQKLYRPMGGNLATHNFEKHLDSAWHVNNRDEYSNKTT